MTSTLGAPGPGQTISFLVFPYLPKRAGIFHAWSSGGLFLFVSDGAPLAPLFFSWPLVSVSVWTGAQCAGLRVQLVFSACQLVGIWVFTNGRKLPAPYAAPRGYSPHAMLAGYKVTADSTPPNKTNKQQKQTTQLSRTRNKTARNTHNNTT